jgi:hypothetical protein
MTEVHDVVELAFADLRGSGSTLDPAPRVTFTGPSGHSFVVSVFSDGRGEWKARFSPDAPGPWHWTLFPQGDEAKSANGRFDVTPSTSRSAWRRHGPIAVHASARAFAHADGTPVFWLADTVWAAPAHATLDEWRDYVAYRAAQGFNVVQINALPQWDASGQPLREPFLRTDGVEDLTRPDPAYFDLLDTMVAVAAEAGLIAAIVVVWFENTPADNEEWTIRVPRRGPFTEASVRAFARYLVARYEASGAVWIISGDSGFRAPASVAIYDAAAEAVVDASARPPMVTSHLNGGTAPSAELNGRSWLDFVIFQSCHFSDSPERARRYAAVSRSFVPHRPILNSEPCYDGICIFDSAANVSPAGDTASEPPPERRRFGREEVRRTSWVSVLCGANAGISFGAHGTWPWHRDGQTYGAMHYGLPLDWRKALVLESGDDVAILRQFMQDLPWWELEPAAGLIVEPACAILGCATVGHDVLIAYMTGPAKVTLPAHLAGAVAADWFDPSTGNTVSAKSPSSRAAAPLASPFLDEDAVLILRGNLSRPR